jgi:hypothetical protein
MSKPDFIAYSVVPGKDRKKPYWHRLGSAFKQAKGDGYNIQLNSMPIDGRIVLVPPKHDETEAA